MRGRVLFAVLALCALQAGRADAATYCAGVQASGCTGVDSAAQAFSAARRDTAADTILLGRLTEAGTFTDAPGRPVRVVGLGASATVLRAASGAPALRLQDAGSRATELRLEGGDAPGLQLDAGGSLRSAAVSGRVRVRGGEAELASVSVTGAAAGVQAGCDGSAAEITLSHVTLAGGGPAGVTADCAVAGRSVALRASNTIVWGFARGFALGAGADLAAEYSDFPEAAGGTNVAVDPGFAVAGDVRLRPDSPLVDAGRPGSLTAAEPHEDALGYVRAADGYGDGGPRRDIGALELQPPAPPAPMGNVLSNPGAEAGMPATDDTSSPAPPGWTRAGGFTFVRYGTVAGNVPFPTRRAGEALGAGDAFFAAGPGGDGSATQVADVGAAAPEIDLGLGTVALSALLGGYRASTDGAIVSADFRDPAGARLGRIEIGPVTADQRAGASNLLPRAASAAIPPLTRTIAVTLRSTPASGGYDDAYFDSVALVPMVSGTPAPGPPRGGGTPRRSFAGISLLSPRAAVDSRRRAWLRLGCASRTVGKCRGAVTLTARPGRRSERRIGSRRIAVRAGRQLRLRVPLARAGARLLRNRRRVRGRFYGATRDGQGLTRTTTSPLRLRRGRQFRAS